MYRTVCTIKLRGVHYMNYIGMFQDFGTEDVPVNARDICGPEKWVSALTGIITDRAHRFFRSELLICIYGGVPRSLPEVGTAQRYRRLDSLIQLARPQRFETTDQRAMYYDTS